VQRELVGCHIAMSRSIEFRFENNSLVKARSGPNRIRQIDTG
jgi:hypothetical protein